MNESFNYKNSKNLNNGRNDDDEKEEEEEEEKQFIIDIHTNVRQGKTVTQREMYYCASAKEPLLFSRVAHVLVSYFSSRAGTCRGSR